MSSRITLVALAIVGLIATTASVRGADVEAGRRKSQPCAACHGADGNATIAGTPSLAGHPAFYTHWQLLFFQNAQRRDPQMAPIAANLTTDDMADLAAYYAAQPSRPRPGRPLIDAATREAGERLTGVHHCTQCHGPGLMGQQTIPRLVGQDQQYLLRRLRNYKAQTSSDLEGQMSSATQALTMEDLELLAKYIASLPR